MNEEVIQGPYLTRLDLVLDEVGDERTRQNRKYGEEHDKHHSDHEWLTILMKEAAECAKAMEDNPAALATEVIQVAAVAVAWAEQLKGLAPENDCTCGHSNKDHSRVGNKQFCHRCWVSCAQWIREALLEITFRSPPHEPSARCVDTCNNPLECKEEWHRWQAGD